MKSLGKIWAAVKVPCSPILVMANICTIQQHDPKLQFKPDFMKNSSCLFSSRVYAENISFLNWHITQLNVILSSHGSFRINFINAFTFCSIIFQKDNFNEKSAEMNFFIWCESTYAHKFAFILCLFYWKLQFSISCLVHSLQKEIVSVSLFLKITDKNLCSQLNAISVWTL